MSDVEAPVPSGFPTIKPIQLNDQDEFFSRPVRGLNWDQVAEQLRDTEKLAPDGEPVPWRLLRFDLKIYCWDTRDYRTLNGTGFTVEFDSIEAALRGIRELHKLFKVQYAEPRRKPASESDEAIRAEELRARLNSYPIPKVREIGQSGRTREEDL